MAGFQATPSLILCLYGYDGIKRDCEALADLDPLGETPQLSVLRTGTEVVAAKLPHIKLTLRRESQRSMREHPVLEVQDRETTTGFQLAPLSNTLSGHNQA